jgi:hypothetical protein
MQIPFPEGDRFLTADSDTEAAPVAEGAEVQRSLQTVLIRALGTFGLLPVLVLGLGAGVWDYRVRLQQAEVALQAAATSASADLDLFLQAHRSAVVQVASLLRDQTPRAWTEPSMIDVLERTRAAFPALLTMLVTDADGRIIAGSFDGRTGIGREQWHQTDVSDRNYFRRPRDSGEPAISEVFIGRGFGTDPLCAVSAPVLDTGARFAGVVQGAIRLDALSRAFAAARHHPGLELVILDPAGKVAFASSGLGIEVLASAPKGLLRDVPVGMPEFRSPMIPALPGGDSLVFESNTELGAAGAHAAGSVGGRNRAAGGRGDGALGRASLWNPAGAPDRADRRTHGPPRAVGAPGAVPGALAAARTGAAGGFVSAPGPAPG